MDGWSAAALIGADPVLADVTYQVSDGLSNYDALQLTAEKRLRHGLTMLIGYTWSHAIDNTGTEFGGGTGTPQDPRCRNCDRFTASYTYNLPFGKGQTLLSRLLGGWQTNGFITLETRFAFHARPSDPDHQRHGQPPGPHCQRQSVVGSEYQGLVRCHGVCHAGAIHLR